MGETTGPKTMYGWMQLYAQVALSAHTQVLIACGSNNSAMLIAV